MTKMRIGFTVMLIAIPTIATAFIFFKRHKYSQEARVLRALEIRGGTLLTMPHMHGRIACELFGCFDHGSAASINVSDTRFTDRDIAMLQYVPELYSCMLAGTDVTDDGVKHLVQLMGDGRLPTLKTVDLSRTRVTDEGLIALLSLDSIMWMQLNHTKITDRGLAAAEHSRQLLMIKASDTLITDRALERIVDGPPLSFIGVSRTAVTDDGLAFLARCKTLRGIRARDCNISIKGIRHLYSLSDLQSLDIVGARVSRDDIAEIATHLPNTRLTHSFGSQVEADE